MAYFLRQTKNKNSKGLYLQIYSSFYDTERKRPRNLCHQTLGYASDLIAQGHEDPVAYGKQLVAELNQEFRETKEENRIGDVSLLRFLGYLPAKSIFEQLRMESYLNAFQMGTKTDDSLSRCLEALVYASLVSPGSKPEDWEKILPGLYGSYDFSHDQILSALDLSGRQYEKIVEAFTFQTRRIYPFNTKHTCFFCMNFCSEFCLGLLTDADGIPISMKVCPGSPSEMPAIDELIHDLKKTSDIQGRTILVAGEETDYIGKIHPARKAGDGYIFSESLEELHEDQRAWIFDEQGWNNVRDEKGNVICRYKCKTGWLNGERSLAENECENIRGKEIWTAICRETMADPTGTDFLHEGNVKKLSEEAGCILLISSGTDLKPKEMYEIYQTMRQMEESFLNIQPVSGMKRERISAYCLICYIRVLLERIFQVLILNNRFSAEEIDDFFRNFQVLPITGCETINVSPDSPLIEFLAEMTQAPLTDYRLSKARMKKLLNLQVRLPEN